MSQRKTSDHGTTKCAVWSGRADDTSVAEMLEQQLRKTPRPVLIYRDPENGPVPIKTFQGLTTPDRFAAVDETDIVIGIVEARLFYSEGMLHVLARGSGSRWAAWCEVADEQPRTCPAWLPVADKSHDDDFPATFHTQPILLRKPPEQGRVHTGLSESRLTRNAKARLYFQAGVLQWWRLMFDE